MSQAATQMCGQRNILIQINSFKFSFTPTHIHVFCLNVFRNGAEAETAACTSDHQEEASRSRSHSSLAGFEHIPVTAASLLLSLRAHAGWAICRGSKILEIFSAETRKISLLLQQQQSALSKRRRWWTAHFTIWYSITHPQKLWNIQKSICQILWFDWMNSNEVVVKSMQTYCNQGGVLIIPVSTTMCLTHQKHFLWLNNYLC